MSTAPPAPDIVLRNRIIDALRTVPMTAGIGSRVAFGQLADAVLALGSFDIVFTDGLHIHQCPPCHHGRPADHDTDYCPGCGAGCRTTFPGGDEPPPAAAAAGGLRVLGGLAGERKASA